MKAVIKKEPRRFSAGDIEISDHGQVELDPWDMISICSHDRACDITATEWGLYLGGSTNSRMKDEGYRVCVVKNSMGRFFINAVEVDKADIFEKYLIEQSSEVVQWLDR